MEMNVRIKSAFAPVDSKDGTRYLVETLWPEGADTYYLSPYTWAHELAPSYELKERALWKHWTRQEFREEYRKELQESKGRFWFDLVVQKAREGTVTLLHNSQKKEWQMQPEDTSAGYLKELLEAELSASRWIPQSRTLSAAGVSPDGISYEDTQQWFNEGGR